MNTYIYTTAEVTITIQALDEDNAYCLLADRIQELTALGVAVHVAPWDFNLNSVF